MVLGNDLVSLEVTDNTGKTVNVRVGGEVDLFTAAEFELGLRTLSESLGSADVVLDLTNTDFIDSRGVGVLSVVAAELDAQGRSLTIQNVTGAVRKVVEMELSETLGLRQARPAPSE